MSESLTQDIPHQARTLQDRRVSRMRERHWSVVFISVVVIVLAFCLNVTDEQRVEVSGWSSLPVPELCSSRLWFGISCPGCGLTRSFVHLAHGRVAESIATHRVGWILAFVIVLQIPYRIIALQQSPVGGLESRWPGWVGSALIVMLLGNWVLAQLSI